MTNFVLHALDDVPVLGTDDIDTIVIGYNEGWKHKVNLGSKTNQNFVGIPYLNLIRKIEYKAEDNGIRVIRHEESYTSKCPFLDGEQICKHKMYKGKRVHGYCTGILRINILKYWRFLLKY